MIVLGACFSHQSHQRSYWPAHMNIHEHQGSQLGKPHKPRIFGLSHDYPICSPYVTSAWRLITCIPQSCAAQDNFRINFPIPNWRSLLGEEPKNKTHTHRTNKWQLMSLQYVSTQIRKHTITSYLNPPTPLWRWRRAYWGAHSNTKCSMTFVNIAVAISALAGGGAKTVSHRDQTPKTVSHRDQPMVVFSTFFEDFWVSEPKRVLKWNFGSFW